MKGFNFVQLHLAQTVEDHSKWIIIYSLLNNSLIINHCLSHQWRTWCSSFWVNVKHPETSPALLHSICQQTTGFT